MWTCEPFQLQRLRGRNICNVFLIWRRQQKHNWKIWILHCSRHIFSRLRESSRADLPEASRQTKTKLHWWMHYTSVLNESVLYVSRSNDLWKEGKGELSKSIGFEIENQDIDVSDWSFMWETRVGRRNTPTADGNRRRLPRNLRTVSTVRTSWTQALPRLPRMEKPRVLDVCCWFPAQKCGLQGAAATSSRQTESRLIASFTANEPLLCWLLYN